MGSMHLIFEMNDTGLLECLNVTGFFQERSQESIHTRLEHVRRRNLNHLKRQDLKMSCFISESYEAQISDFDTDPPAVTGHFGPAAVIGFARNSAEVSICPKFLAHDLQVFENHIPFFRKSLTYAGTLFCDYGLLHPGYSRSDFESILRGEPPNNG